VWITNKWTWLPLYAFLIGLLIWQYRKGVWRVLVLVALLITATDRFTSGFMKPYFARLRPCHNEELTCVIDLITGGCGGKFGFASSHAANVFGITIFLVLLWRKRSLLVHWLWLWAIV
ncbi:MAG: phosphatase PAP2 family protein, partial [Phototrophicales bacterium]